MRISVREEKRICKLQTKTMKLDLGMCLAQKLHFTRVQVMCAEKIRTIIYFLWVKQEEHNEFFTQQRSFTVMLLINNILQSLCLPNMFQLLLNCQSELTEFKNVNAARLRQGLTFNHYC